MTEVKIRKAFCWTCESCGTDQFEHGVMRRNKNKEAMQRIGTPLSVTPAPPRSVVVELHHPDEVTCNNCNTTYTTYFYEKPTKQEYPE